MPAVNFYSNRIKNNKGLIDANSPVAFTAGNAFPLPKFRVAGRIPTGKPTVEEAFPMLEANPEVNDNADRVVAKMPSKNRLTPLSILVCDTILSARSRTILKVLFDPGSTVTDLSWWITPLLK